MPVLRVGGAERFVSELITHFDPKHVEAAVVSLHPAEGTEIEERLSGQAIPTWYINKRMGFDPRVFRAIHCVVKGFRPDIVHTHQYVLPYSLPVIVYNRIPGRIHTVVTLAEHEVEYYRRWVHRVAFKCGVVPVAVADEVARSVRRVYGIKDVHMIPTAIPVDDYRLSATARVHWRAREGFSSTDVLLVCVAGLRTEKNHALLLDAFARVANRHQDAHLLLVGDGVTRPRLLKQCETLEVRERIHFLGFRRDLPITLAAADVFVLASDWEGNPLSVMEAMAAGMPVISTAVGGIPELVQDGVSGLLVPVRDSDALAAAIEYLLTNVNARHAFGAAAAQQATRRFGVRAAAESYTRLYESVLARHGGGHPR